MARKRIKSELSMVFGKEPTFPKKLKKKDYNSVLIPALQWYGQYGGAETSQALKAFHKSWLVDWATAHGIKPGTYAIPNEGISTFGAVARCAMRGFKLNKLHEELLFESFKNWPMPEAKVIDRAALARSLSIKARVKNENDLKPFMTVYDNAVDSVMGGAKKWDITVTGELNATQKKELTVLYKLALADFKELLRGKNVELTESFRKLPKALIRRMITLHEEILESIKLAGNRGTVIRKAKAVRTKKAKPASAYIRKLQFMPAHVEYGISSVDAEKLVGANTIYLFETKKRLLKKFDATGIAGALVSGTTLKNVKGTCKKIRKPEELLSGFDKLPLSKCFKVFDDVKAMEKVCTGRVNSDTVILRVFE